MKVSCVGGDERGYRRGSGSGNGNGKRRVVKKRSSTKKVKDLELSVGILIEEGLPNNDPEILVSFCALIYVHIGL